MTFIRVAAIVWAAGCLATGAWIAYMVNDKEPPYEWEGGFLNKDGTVDGGSYLVPDPADQQSMVTANWKVTKINRVCPAALQRSFYDHETGRLATTLDATEASRTVKIGDIVIPRSFQLPPGLPPVTDYDVLACFECNAYQKVWEPLCLRTPKITFRVNR